MVCPVSLQGIFLTQGLTRYLLHCRQFLYRLSHQRSPVDLWGQFKPSFEHSVIDFDRLWVVASTEWALASNLRGEVSSYFISRKLHNSKGNPKVLQMPSEALLGLLAAWSFVSLFCKAQLSRHYGKRQCKKTTLWYRWQRKFVCCAWSKLQKTQYHISVAVDTNISIRPLKLLD